MDLKDIGRDGWIMLAKAAGWSVFFVLLIWAISECTRTI